MQWDRETVTHLNEHVKWPATGQQIMQTCNMMSHVPESDRQMAMDKLQDNKMYNTPDEAIRDLNK